MQVGTYPTRGFATLGPSELQPPLATAYIRCVYISFYLVAQGRRQTLYFILQFSRVLCF
jgi:hypothetical protein